MTGKPRTNFIVDGLMVLGGSLLAGTGFLMKFVLIPGKERAAAYGRNVDLFLWGFDRHEWGTLHLWLAFGLIALLAVHILLHLGWIRAMFRCLIAGRAARKASAVVFLALCAISLLFAFLVQPEVRGGFGGHGRGMGRMEYLLRH